MWLRVAWFISLDGAVRRGSVCQLWTARLLCGLLLGAGRNKGPRSAPGQLCVHHVCITSLAFACFSLSAVQPQVRHAGSRLEDERKRAHPRTKEQQEQRPHTRVQPPQSRYRRSASLASEVRVRTLRKVATRSRAHAHALCREEPPAHARTQACLLLEQRWRGSARRSSWRRCSPRALWPSRRRTGTGRTGA